MDNLIAEGKAYATYVELREPKLALMKGDVGEAIDWFKDEVGTMPKLVLLNPKCQQFADEVPEGITIEISGMPLAHEVMMAAVETVKVEDTFLTIPKGRATQPEQPKDPLPTGSAKITKKGRARPKPPTRVFAPKNIALKKSGGGSSGRPAKDFPVEKIRQMFSKGLHEKEIRRRLLADGTKISRRTLFYIKSGQRQLI